MIKRNLAIFDKQAMATVISAQEQGIGKKRNYKSNYMIKL